MKFLLLSGSFRSDSRSLAILNAIQRRFPVHDFVLPDLTVLPFYSEDLAFPKPTAVEGLISEVASADGIVVCSPEYNHSVPAVIKNAIDWVSRPAFESVLKGMPVTIVTQASSPVGGARAQAHFKLIFDSTLSIIHPVHEMMISDIDRVVGLDGAIIDAKVSNRLDRHMNGFFDFVVQISRQR
ncbi:NADPH-dependent FMN reductase [Ketobacter sp.]|uniref:NADPH-dependent FMN reductase n=1 Tax=Ketobacter sp. TaxID=2083498 RepID=UPI000F1F3EDF|nr:NADPH-dependent FMN reductase [Ketobacter sp.]RLT97325.1 MAG: NAD(P)H-dependent oxidoreductase [Ketobacter sp.]